MKQRSLLSRVFFQDPEKWQSAASTGEVDSSDFDEMTLAELNSQGSRQWARFSISTKGLQSEREITDFPAQVGRSAPGGIELDDTKVSRNHATIDFYGDMLQVKDENSRNGVIVGGEKIVPGIATPLKPGVVLKVGNSEIIVTGHSGIADAADRTEYIGNEDAVATEWIPYEAVNPEPATVAIAHAASQPKLEVLPEPEPDLELESNLEPVSMPEPKSEPESEPKPEPEPESEEKDVAEPQSEPEPKSEQKPIANPKPFIIPPKPKSAQPVNIPPKADVPKPSDVKAACGSCGYLNEPNDKFCAGCGASMSSSQPAETSAVATFCNQCGWKNDDKSKFCGRCGNDLRT